jgi:hypothetical protein
MWNVKLTIIHSKLCEFASKAHFHFYWPLLISVEAASEKGYYTIADMRELLIFPTFRRYILPPSSGSKCVSVYIAFYFEKELGKKETGCGNIIKINK